MTEQLKQLREALRRVQYQAASLADAQVIALEALTTSQPAQAGEMDERAAFEAWVAGKWPWGYGDAAWEAWQARASLPTQPAAQATRIWINHDLRDVSVREQDEPGWVEFEVQTGSIAAQATPEPVPADQAKWCEYVAGMVDCWVSAEWSNYHHKDEDLRVKAIAGIIERRLWALNKQRATPPQQAAGEPVGEVFYAADGGDDETGAGCYMKPCVRWIGKAPEAGTKLHAHPAPGVPEDVQRNAVRWNYAMDWGNSGFAVCRRVGTTGTCWEPIKTSGPIDDAMLAAAQAKGGEHA